MKGKGSRWREYQKTTTYADDEASPRVDNSEPLVLASGSQATAVSVEAHGVDDVRVTVYHVQCLAFTHVPHYQLHKVSCFVLQIWLVINICRTYLLTLGQNSLLRFAMFSF